MLDLVSGLIWLVIIFAFLVPWFRSMATRQQASPPGRPVSGGPRGLAASGGYEPVEPPVQTARVQSVREAGRRNAPDARVEAEESIRIRSARQEARGKDTRAPSSARADAVRRALANPESVRTAFVLTEVLTPPPGIRDRPSRPGDSTR